MVTATSRTIDDAVVAPDANEVEFKGKCTVVALAEHLGERGEEHLRYYSYQDGFQDWPVSLKVICTVNAGELPCKLGTHSYSTVVASASLSLRVAYPAHVLTMTLYAPALDPSPTVWI